MERNIGRRPVIPTVLTFVLAGVFAAAATLTAPTAANVTARLFDPQTARSLFGAGVAFAAAQPGAVELVRALDGGAAISRGNDRRLTVLLLGSDYRPTLAGERTDTIIVMTIHPATKQISAVSIPRDIAQVRLPNGTVYKSRINSMYAYYRRALGSSAAALAQVEKIIEFNLQIEIDYHALIRMPAFEALIDHVAGITVAVPSEIKDPKFWDDPRGPQGVYFPASASWTLRSATTLCNGYYKTGKLSKPGAKCQRALVYARTRKGTGNNDFKRALRQQDIVAAAITKVRQRGQSNLGALLNSGNQQVAKNNVITNIPRTSSNVLELYNLFAGAKLVNKAVLRPKKYAARISGTATYRLKLDAVRALTNVWFAPVK